MAETDKAVRTAPQRRKLVSGPLGRGDKWFFRTTSIAANFAFVLVGLILVFLFSKAWPVLQSQGLDFVFGNTWSVEDGTPAVMQLGPMLWGSIQIAIIGIALATPMAIAAAYLIVFLLPARIAKVATALIDLLAALPSVVIGPAPENLNDSSFVTSSLRA